MDKPIRKTLLGLAHKAAKQLGWDEDLRREAQLAFNGKPSLKDYTDAELLAWLWRLKEWGADIGIPLQCSVPAQVTRDRPTRAQIATIERLAASLGLSEQALTIFVRRTTGGVGAVQWLDRRGASAVITGLERWARGKGIDTRSKTAQALDILLGEDIA
ncbi:MAG: DUF1018 domain-containing protein [Deltaproteobacteria bacterium]|nr:DUF1018 domain-containing protein [Deltaproteobacteria bacterium]